MGFRLGYVIRLILGLILALGGLSAQVTEPSGRQRWRDYGYDEGLQDLAITTICEDQRGLIWVGTEGGVHRFDGKGFQGFHRKSGLPSAMIYALLISPDGKLWAGTRRGLARLEGDHFVKVGAGLPDLATPITALVTGPGGALYVGTNKGPYRQVAGDRFEAMASWPGSAVSALATLHGEVGLCVASWDGQRARIWKAVGATWQELSGPTDFGLERLDAMVVDGTGTLWARSHGTLWALHQSVFEPAPFPAPRAPWRASLYVDGMGRLWIPGISDVVLLEAGKVERWGTMNGWPGRVVQALLVDREGSLWQGGEGLRRIVGRSFWRAYGPEDGLHSAYVWSFWRDQNRTLYAGTQLGLARLGPAGWQMISGTEDTQIRSIVQGPDGAFYLAGSPWILRWDPVTGRIAKFGPGQGVLANGRIYRLLFDRSGTLWVATDGGGLLRGSGQGSRWTFTPEPLPGSTPKESIADLHEDGEGRLWAPGDNGIALYEAGHWRRFTKVAGLREDAVDFMRSLRNGDLLLAYANRRGLARARYVQGQLRILNHFDAVIDPTRNTYLMGEDVQGNLWVGSSVGVHLVSPSGASELFTYRDGLINENTNNMAFLAEPNGDVWLGTINGIARFDAKTYHGPAGLPLLEIYAFTLGSTSYFAVPPRPLEVAFRNNTFEAQFAAMSILHENDLRLEFRLEGLESDWHAARGRSERYASLPAGNYAFQIRCKAGDGSIVYSVPVRFRVLPPWWGSWLFRGLVVLGLAGGVFIYTRWRTRKLHHMNALLEGRVMERTQALDASEHRAWEAYARLQVLAEQRSQFLGIVAHDLRNPLNGIVLAAQLLEGEEDRARRAATARKIAKQGLAMSDLVGRLLDKAVVEEGHVDPRFVDLSLSAVAREVLDLHQVRAKEKGIVLNFDPGEAIPNVQADRMFTKAILDNLVSNALKYSPSGTRTTVRLCVKDAHVRVSVQDQGPGLTLEDQVRLFGRFAKLSASPTGGESSTGLGLSIVKHMADAMGCDLSVDTQPGAGATFHVGFPIERSNSGAADPSPT